MCVLPVRSVSVKSVISTSNLPVADYSVNPYIGCTHACKYCYASFMKRFTGHTEAWGKFLDVKYWPEIHNAKRYAGKHFFIGSVTDPYLPQEAHYGRTRAFLSQLQGSGAAISIATKSDLVLRDLELIRSFPNARVAWSINTLDDAFQRDMDCAVPVARRLAAMKAFYDAGVRTTCFISPIFPDITDVPAIITRAQAQCHLVWLENLNLRGGYRAEIMAYIQKSSPQLLPLYHEIYERKRRDYWQRLDAQLRAFAADRGLAYVTNDDSMTRPFDAPPVIVNFFYHERITKSAQRHRAAAAESAGA